MSLQWYIYICITMCTIFDFIRFSFSKNWNVKNMDKRKFFLQSPSNVNVRRKCVHGMRTLFCCIWSSCDHQTHFSGEILMWILEETYIHRNCSDCYFVKLPFCFFNEYEYFLLLLRKEIINKIIGQRINNNSKEMFHPQAKFASATPIVYRQ